MTLSFHVCRLPAYEEIMSGVNADYEAFFVDVPDELFPERLLNVLKDKSQFPSHVVTGIAAHKE